MEEINKSLKETQEKQEKNQTGEANSSRLEVSKRGNKENTNQGNSGYGKIWVNKQELQMKAQSTEYKRWKRESQGLKIL